ncbi:MAG: hypothetical protein ACI4LM_01095 [Anaerovoracaceae bacterium]
MTKQEVMDRLNELETTSTDEWKAVDDHDYYYYTAYAKDWENYGKSRTYITAYEKRTTTHHLKSLDCGYYDNQTNEYHPGMINIMTIDAKTFQRKF